MSLQKRKTKKCLNNSLSEVSNTENLRQSFIFKNDILCDIRNISGAEDKSMKKPQKSHYECKRRTDRNSENKTCNNSENKAYNYTAVCKMIEEKNILIADQEKQLDNLKGILEKVRKELDQSKVQSEKKKIEELTVLKKQELENVQNIKELDILRTGLKQMKEKNQALQISKDKIVNRNKKLLEENQELTVKLNAMKQECSTISADEKTISDLKYEVQVLKDQNRTQKELESQKTVLEQRYRSMQRKLNEYIVKYNNIQSKFNDSQIKYYKAQKENDDLKLSNQELEGENQNYSTLLQEERNVLKQQTAKWNERIEKLEESRAERTDEDSHGFKAIFTELQNKYHKLQCKSDFESKMLAKEEQIMGVKLEFCNKLATKEEELAEITQKLDMAQLKIDEISKSYELQLTEAKQALQMHQLEQDKSTQILEYKNESQLKTQKEQFEKKINQKDTCINELQAKSEQLVIENERINKIYKQLNDSMSKEKQQNCHSLSRVLEDKNYEVSKLLLKIEQHKKSLKAVQEQVQDRDTLIQTLQQQININSQAHGEKYNGILNKITVLEQQLIKKEAAYRQQLKTRNQQNKQLEQTLQLTNNQLKSIKIVIGQYKLQISSLRSQVEQKGMQENNFKSNNQGKLEQQIAFYRNKYEQTFQQNIQLSERLCEIQKQHTCEINKHTELMRRNSELEIEMKEVRKGREQCEKRSGDKLLTLEHQNREIKDRLEQMSRENQNYQSEFKELRVTQHSTTLQYEQQLRAKEEHKQQCRQWEEEKFRLVNSVSSVEQKWKDELHQKERIMLSHREEVVGFERKIDQLQSVLRERETMLRERETLLREKESIIHQNYQIISSKEQEINRLSDFTKTSENEQYRQAQEHNAQLTRKLEEITSQFNRAHQQLKEVSEQASKYRSTINLLEKEVNSSKKKNIELENSNAELHRQKYSDNDQNNQEKRRLKQVILMLQTRIESIESEKIGQMQKYQSANRQLKKMQNQYSKMSRSALEESNRKNKQNGRQFDNYRSQIKILQEENIQLQSLMEKQLNKRKAIIEQLIQEKKVLYEQISRH